MRPRMSIEGSGWYLLSALFVVALTASTARALAPIGPTLGYSPCSGTVPSVGDLGLFVLAFLMLCVGATAMGFWMPQSRRLFRTNALMSVLVVVLASSSVVGVGWVAAGGDDGSISDAELACYVGGTCPHCESPCFAVTGTFNECLHRSTADPCDTTRCIENILDTVSCTLVAGEGTNACNTEPVTPAASAVRQIGRTQACNSNVGWHVWKNIYNSTAGGGCVNAGYQVRCDTTTCAGTPFEADSFVGVKHKCI